MRLVVVGAAGRMGQMLIRAVRETSSCALVGAVERDGSPALGQDAGVIGGGSPVGVTVTADPLEVFAKADGVLDFTAPDATVAFAALAAQARIVHVIGTTGLSDEHFAKLEAAARHARIVQSGNMSLGVNLLAGLVRQAAATLGDDFDIEIVEMHHRMKVDAPSGTALLLGEAAAEGRRLSLRDHSIRTRDGHTGPRPTGHIGFASLRGGSVVGDHTVIFAGGGERLELTHRAEDRSLFARGAIKAAQWAFPQKPGYYTMADVLGLADRASS
ncbi:4-hydroxy-tetrahydrodipicolinate reductase [Microvirga massiliensis]|uniref:4-hydroxy-tetrahydrodipicolinate reductase n=1 Tax=Microvirga massiliensis TaxID=1033741 RepID=UPI00062B8539|nr:4-hydroxy-tetrahydrodipicolinate reductase [Microvirga massiliensis]